MTERLQKPSRSALNKCLNVLQTRSFALRGGDWAHRLGRQLSSWLVAALRGKGLLQQRDFLYYAEESGLIGLVVGRRPGWSPPSGGKVWYYRRDFVYYVEESGLVSLVVGR